MKKQTLLIILFLATLTAVSYASLTDNRTISYYPVVKELETKNISIDDSLNLNINVKTDTLITADDSFTVDNFKAYLAQIKIPHPHIVYAIARHESGFGSDLFLSTNNMFGMKNPKSRQTKSINKGNGYAKFEHWTHSVDDFYLYMKARGLDELTEREVISKLNQPKYYASKGGYGTRIKKHFDEYLD